MFLKIQGLSGTIRWAGFNGS